jgi:hypothetical protein
LLQSSIRVELLGSDLVQVLERLLVDFLILVCGNVIIILEQGLRIRVGLEGLRQDHGLLHMDLLVTFVHRVYLAHLAADPCFQGCDLNQNYTKGTYLFFK